MTIGGLLDDLTREELNELVEALGVLWPGTSDAGRVLRLLSSLDEYACMFLARRCRARKVLMWLVSVDGFYLERVPPRLRDRELCLAAVSSNGLALQNVPMGLRDMEMCVAAAGCYGHGDDPGPGRYDLVALGLLSHHVPEPLKASIWEELGLDQPT